jgi:thiosulfate dehydrogenase
MQQQEQQLANVLGLLTRTVMVLAVLPVLFFLFVIAQSGNQSSSAVVKPDVKPEVISWAPPDMSKLNAEDKALVLYGKALISGTAVYLGPNGKVAQISNGMNCQNCHLDAGTKIFGNNYSGVAANYPKFRERSGSVESVEKRINDCFERSLNGKALDTLSHEMKAMKAYILWLGSAMPKGQKVKGSGLKELAYLGRAADPKKGATVYKQKCETCHGENGEGKGDAKHFSYEYPPLWGPFSYNNGAGLYRLSRFAGYVRSNMPQGATYDNPQLTDEEAWDVAAFVNSQQRPSKDLSADWPKIAGKPVDHPYGPYVDPFNEQQHKYGPFQPIAAYYQSQAKK